MTSTLILKAIAILTAIIATIWIVINPSLEALITLLGSISGIITLIVADRTNSGDSINRSGIANTKQPSSNPPITSGCPIQPPVISPEPVQSASPFSTVETPMYIGGMIIGGMIGFVVGVPNGALIGVAAAGVGVVAGLFISSAILETIQSAIGLIEFLWITRWFWVGVGTLLAIGYVISGKL